ASQIAADAGDCYTMIFSFISPSLSALFSFLFRMIRPPLSSPLFPYTTLFRSVFVGSSGCGKTTLLRMVNRMVDPSAGSVLINHRSEEHTSELQSRFDLVCRLLLEKKKVRMTIAGAMKLFDFRTAIKPNHFTPE